MSGWSCPLPLRDYPNVVMGHGGGGHLSAELVEHLFLPAFRNDALAAMGDSAVLATPSGRLAFTTDSYVVRPLFFPGGSIGELAVNGTVNDLAMSGAAPCTSARPSSWRRGCPWRRSPRSSGGWPTPPATPALQSLPAIPRWWRRGTATAASSPRRVSARCLRGSTSARTSPSLVTG